MQLLPLRKVCFAVLLAFASLNAHAQEAIAILAPSLVAVPNDTDWQIRPPAAGKLVFKGMPSGVGAGAVAGTLVIPAPGVAGIVASLIVYGLITSGQQAEQRTKAQVEADKVLAPYQPALDKLSVNGVYQAAIDKTRFGRTKTLLVTPSVGVNGAVNGTNVIEIVPVFSLTQDARAIVLEGLVSVFSPNNSPNSANQLIYKNVVRVVSNPQPLGEATLPLLERWSASDALLLGQVASGLIAESLDMVLTELAKGADVPEAAQQTIRYAEGGLQQVERATLVSKRCDRLNLKTLRGWLMSVPVAPPSKTDAAVEPCDAVGASIK